MMTAPFVIVLTTRCKTMFLLIVLRIAYLVMITGSATGYGLFRIARLKFAGTLIPLGFRTVLIYLGTRSEI